MLRIYLKPSFVRKFDKLPQELQEETLEKISLLEDPKNHRLLRVHKLQGALAGRCSFSVNFKYRVVFEYEGKNTAVLLTLGDHEIYK